MEAINRPSKMEVLANTATIVVSILLSVVLVKVFLLPQSSAPLRLPGPLVGMNIKASIPDIDWAKNDRTLVLALSTHCHFCTESAPFFRRLTDETGRQVKIVAVLPQSAGEAQTYLTGEGVHINDVKQAPLSSIGITGTPTLLLVDKSGIVTDVWVGKLQPEQEAQVLSALENKKSGG